MADTFQPPFRSCIQEGGASGLMCAYNLVNGVPSCGDRDLLTKTAREEWGFQGYIVSDCDAVSLIHEKQNYTDSHEYAVVAVLRAGESQPLQSASLSIRSYFTCSLTTVFSMKP